MLVFPAAAAERCHKRRCAVLLEHKRVTGNATHHRQHLLLQQNFAVVPAVHLHSWLNKNSSVQPSFETAMDTISDLENVG